MSAEPGYVAETLAWCNARRAERGRKPLKKLPKGIPHDARSCPCGEASGFRVYEAEAKDESTSTWVDVPRSVGRFVRAFDGGKLPQYEAKR